MKSKTVHATTMPAGLLPFDLRAGAIEAVGQY